MRKTYVIGSNAMRVFFPNFDREPFDLDLLVHSKEELDNCSVTQFNSKRVEYHVIPVLYDYVEENGMSPDILLTLKSSHIFWDIKWEKHMFDINFMFEHGCKLIKPLFYRLYEYWQTVHGKNKRSDLKMSTKDFFDNALKTYDHDHLHTIINPIPTYTKVLIGEVEVSEEKFDMLTHEEKIELVREEIYVMAYERLNGRDYRVAYAWMLKKFIREHAPIWETFFIFENYRELHYPAVNYKKILDDGLQ